MVTGWKNEKKYLLHTQKNEQTIMELLNKQKKN